MKRIGNQVRPFFAAWLAALVLGCFTEVGNPGEEPKVTTTFRIDYSTTPGLGKSAAMTAAWSSASPSANTGKLATQSGLNITQLFFNIVEVNYRTIDDVEGRIFKVPDSLGKQVDFTGKDTSARLPAVAVPPEEWTEYKLESRVPKHALLSLDTVDALEFKDRGYIKGYLPVALGGLPFLCQLPNWSKINLVYNDSVLSQWRVDNAYHIDVVFFANRWLQLAGLPALVEAGKLEAFADITGRQVVLIDQEHNVEAYDALTKAFFKSFNSFKVWKEGDSIPALGSLQKAASRTTSPSTPTW
jgi:hypothetical protein